MVESELKECQLAIHDLIEHQDYENAMPLIYAVLEEYPNDAATLNFLGFIWLDSGKEAFAYQLFRRALQESPGNKALWTSLGRAAHELGRTQEAINCFLKSAELDPDYALAYSNASATLVQVSDWDAAEKSAKMALECDPNDLNAQLNLAHCYLATGRWAEGWAQWGKSLGGKFRKEWSYGDEVRWDGSEGKRLVIYGEQGLGDEILYASCVPDAIAVSSKVIIDCDPKLEGLFARSFPAAVVHGTRREESPDWIVGASIDARCPVGGLPEFFRKTDKDFSGNPYLVADPERRLMWRALFDSWKTNTVRGYVVEPGGEVTIEEIMKATPGQVIPVDKLPQVFFGKSKVIGITSHGGRKMTNEKGRKIDFLNWLPLLKKAGYHFVSLDYAPEDTAFLEELHGVKIHKFPFATQSEDYDDTAALIAELDMVIGVNTTALHCAAGLGVKTWCLVPKHHQWRYAYHFYPWSRSMRLIMQGERTWGEVIAQLGEL